MLLDDVILDLVSSLKCLRADGAPDEGGRGRGLVRFVGCTFDLNQTTSVEHGLKSASKKKTASIEGNNALREDRY